MDYTTCYCRSRQCITFGKIGLLSQLKIHDWQHGHPRYRCQVCGEIVSASTGTAYAGIRTDLEVYRRGVKALAEGLRIRATGRLLEADQDRVNHWLPILGRHSQEAMSYFSTFAP
jgi:transposase-like protein